MTIWNNEKYLLGLSFLCIWFPGFKRKVLGQRWVVVLVSVQSKYFLSGRSENPINGLSKDNGEKKGKYFGNFTFSCSFEIDEN